MLKLYRLLKKADAYYLYPTCCLARRFACCQSCSVSAPFGLTALTALRRVLLKNRRWVKV